MLLPVPELAVEYGLFSRRQAREAGSSRADIERNLRTGRWERAGWGLLQVAGRSSRDGDDVVRALLNAPGGAVVGYESAALVHGWDLLCLPRKPLLITPPGGRGGASVPIAEDDICWIGIVPVTRPARTALDIACRGYSEAAVAAIDSAMRSQQVSAGELTELFATSRRRGIQAARRVLQMSDPMCGSVPETQARLLFASRGLPEPVSQLVIPVDGVHYRVDFAWPAARLVVEIDGYGPHSGREAFQYDRTRQNALVNAKWKVLRFTVADIRNDPDRVIAEILKALSEAR